MKGQSVDDCHNYVKVLLSAGKRLFACGTGAFSPQCTWREVRKTIINNKTTQYLNKRLWACFQCRISTIPRYHRFFFTIYTGRPKRLSAHQICNTLPASIHHGFLLTLVTDTFSWSVLISKILNKHSNRLKVQYSYHRFQLHLEKFCVHFQVTPNEIRVYSNCRRPRFVNGFCSSYNDYARHNFRVVSRSLISKRILC